MNEEIQNNVIPLFEPQSIAEYDPAIMKSPRHLSGKTFAIKLLYYIFKDETLSGDTIMMINNCIKDYPELKKEVKERYPKIFI